MLLRFQRARVSKKGLKTSRTKIQFVLGFPLPTVGKQLKSFLGTVNYLRDFVRNHSIIVKPLHDLIANHDKTRRIVWTTETTAAFHEMKLQVSRASTNLQFHLLKCSSRFWGPYYSTSFIIVCYQIMQRFNNDRMIAHKISYTVHCAQKALQLFAHSG